MTFSLLVPALAQVITTITPDGSLSTTVTPNPDGSIHTIEGGTTLGPNQFHSFDRFDVGTGDTATFTGPAHVENILNRVTGGAPSMIDGTLQSEIPGANLYVLNPSGVLFGPRASLDVSGSFYVSTADVLRLGDGGAFHVSLDEQSALSISAPSAFGFLQNNPAGIRIEESVLEVPTGQTLSVVGGDITMTGGPEGLLAAPSGRINLVSVNSPGETVLQPPIAVDHVANLGAITITDNALITVSSEEGGGTVVIRGGHLQVENSNIFADTEGSLDGAAVGIEIVVTREMIATNAVITAEALGEAPDAGDAGEVLIEVPTFILDEGGIISSSTFGPGQGGNATIRVRDTLTITGEDSEAFPSVILAQAVGTSPDAGSAGKVLIEAHTVILNEGGGIGSGTSGPGQGGDVTIRVRDTLIITGENSEGIPSGILAQTVGTSPGSGSAGKVLIEAPTLIFDEGGAINSSTLGPGQGGDVTIRVRDTLLITGEDSEAFSSRILAETLGDSPDAGSAGEVLIEAPTFILDEGGQISSSTFGPGQGGNVTVRVSDTLIVTGANSEAIPSAILAQTGGASPDAGSAGEVLIETPALILDEGGVVSSSTSGPGQGGNVTIRVSDTLFITGENSEAFSSGIFAQTLGDSPDAGSAGEVLIEAPTVILGEGGRISSGTAGPGQGGNVTVRVSDTLIIASENSEAIPSAIFVDTIGDSPDAGSAGEVLIEAPTVILDEGGAISSNTFGPGQGGNVTVRVRGTLIITGANSEVIPSRITVSTFGSGKGGEMIVNARQLQLTEGAQLRASSEGAGNAGGVTVTVQDTLIVKDSAIRTDATVADGGNIDITADVIELRDGRIVTSVGNGEGRGGNITVDANLGLLERSEIRADAFGGPGGNIAIQASGFIADVDSEVTASSEQNVDGTVSIQGLADLSSSFTPLDPDFAAAAALQNDPCIGRLKGEGIGRFTLAGRDRLPTEPGGLLPSPSGQITVVAVATPARLQVALRSQGQRASTQAAWHRGCVR